MKTYTKYGKPIRSIIAKGKHLSHVVHFYDQQVFNGATTYTCLLFLKKSAADECRFVRVNDLIEWQLNREGEEGNIDAEDITEVEWTFTAGPGADLLNKLAQLPIKLSDVADRIFQGLKTGADKAYILQQIEKKRNRTRVYSRQTDSEHWIENAILHTLIKGGDSRAYRLSSTNRIILFPYSPCAKKVILIPDHTMRDEFPLAWDYLTAIKDILQTREHGKMKGRGWYAYTRNQALDVMSLPKIFTPDISPNAAFSLDESGEKFFTGGVSGGYGILISPAYSREYILALLNSKLLDWFQHNIATQMRGGWYSYESRFIRDLPMYVVNEEVPEKKIMHDQIISLVKTMLNLNNQLDNADSESNKLIIQRQIDTTSTEINRLVYDLYGLTEEEIAIVEGTGS